MCAQPLQLNPHHRSTEARILEERLRQKIVGQDEAVHAVIDLYQVFRTGLNLARAPIGEFSFSRPYGPRENPHGRSYGRSSLWRSACSD
jgi:ATP-dependent Clp protease ATP-binding subunit ClpA